MGFWSSIKKAAKKVGGAIKKAAEAVADTVTTAVGGIVETVESIVSWIGSAVSFVVNLVLSIPILGRIINWVLQVVKEVVWRIVGIVDFVLALIGILPVKRMSICVIVLKDKNGSMATETEVKESLNNLIDTFKEEANVKVLPSKAFRMGAYSSFSKPRASDSDWIHFNNTVSADDILDVSCDSGALKDDILVAGSKFELLASTKCFYGNFRRLIGYGAPIVLFVVRNVEGKLGCSLGPLADYVTASGDGIRRDDSITTHECAHACGLWHNDDTDNLMFANAGRGTNLNRWQVAILRNSRHITYF